jgi:hypothetical protein
MDANKFGERAKNKDEGNVTELQKMASGNLSVFITDDVSYESFPELAQLFLARFGGRVIKKFDGPIERIWVVLVRWRPFFLTFDDLPWGLTLEALHRSCNVVAQSIYLELKDSPLDTTHAL